jgi:hypothetical protein
MSLVRAKTINDRINASPAVIITRSALSLGGLPATAS